MLANQTLVAEDGHEVALFPMPYLYMTQDEGGDYSHTGTYNIDFVGYNGSAVITQAPVYAPVTMRLTTTLLTYSGGNGTIWESVDTVHLANGDLDYLTILFMHCNNPPITTIGTVVNQGEVCYYTGDYGYATGDHLHSCCGQGQGGYLVERTAGNWDLNNRVHYWDGVYVNDTGIIVGYGHDWIEWDGPVAPEHTWGEHKQGGFPWVTAWNQWGYR